jgi:hypothetical protein
MIDAGLHGLVAAVRRYHAGNADPGDLEVVHRARLRPLTGGHNNAVYAASLHGQQLCLKLPVVDERGRAEREWQALQVLAAHRPGLAPAPRWYEPDPWQPVVVMQLLPGRHLGGRRLDRRQLTMLARLYAELHQITPATAARPLPAAIGQPAALLRRIGGIWGAPPAGAGPPWQAEAARLWRRWSAGPDPALLLAPAPQVFSRGDPSLANCLWDGRRLVLVDLENAGLRDRALELADLVEHIQACNTPPAAWAWFVGRFDLDDGERARYQAARRLFALFWLTLLKPQPGRDPASHDPAEQLRHAIALFQAR